MKALLTILISLFSSVKSQPLNFRFSDQIANTAGQYFCRVHQGDQITLLTCPSSFEVYKTVDLALRPYSLENSGRSFAITGVRRSLEVGN